MLDSFSKSAAPSTQIDPFSRDYILDPYPYHAQLREIGRVVWLEKYGCWCLPKHDEVKASLMNWRGFSSSAGVGLANFHKEKPWRPPSVLIEADPPEHTPRRAVTGRVMGAANIKRMRPQFEANAAAMVDRILDAGTVDGFADVAKEYVLKVFPDAVGVAPGDRDNLLFYGSMVFNAFGVLNDIFEESARHAAPLTDYILQACKRENLTKDGFGAQIYEAADNGEVTHDEAFMLVRSLLSAGVDTTIYLIANAIWCFAKYPQEWDKLRADPTRARAAVEEVLRFESPFQGAFRTTGEDMEVAGIKMGAEEKVFIVLGSANRDPDRWDNPDVFDIDRKTVGHMAFGAGIHGCVGQMIARLEAECFVQELARRVSKIELTGTPIHKVHNTIRGFETLPVRFVS
ncbi:cytochrome P450 [Roseovarius sp. CH_XMU1461]|uniref:cytochrome P450 n=1 Tax=Roseovarius sp. CH_XMU1461 TaxID=3107777 RepID=UPI0030098E5F